MLDFDKINDFGNGRRESFESLLRILAYREKPIDGIDFQPNDGRGGDGGVEALWITSDRRKIGYQAKYFKSLGEPQLKQMYSSFEKAITTHSELKKYIFAIPFDLMPNRGSKVRGKSQKEKWDERVVEWEAFANKQGIDLEIELWTETFITDMLLREENSGLLRHWFKEEALHDAWFCRRVNSAIKLLGNRYNPESHVGLEIEALFDTISRGPLISKKLASAFEMLGKASVPDANLIDTDNTPVINVQKDASKALNDLLKLARGFSQDLSSSWPISESREKILILENSTIVLKKYYKSVQQKLQNETEKSKPKDIYIDYLNTARSDLRKLSTAFHNLENILGSRYIDAEESRCCLLRGITGAGKSHLLAHVAEKRIEQGLPTILLLGQEYSDSSFWFHTGKSLGLMGESSEDILGALDAVGLRKQQRILLLVDAINEGVGFKYWHLRIPSLIEDLKRYPHVVMAFSCREEHLPSDLHVGIFEGLPEFRVHGFDSQEERKNAIMRYLGHEFSTEENIPWIGPRFSNPLFLKIVSEAIDNDVISGFPSDFEGNSEVIGLYLNALSHRLEEGLRYAEGISRDIIDAACSVAGKMVKDGSNFLTSDDANLLIDECFSGKAPPEKKSWLQVLKEVSLFRLEDPPSEKRANRLKPPPKRVRFTFQFVQDHLMAVSLVNSITVDHKPEAFASGDLLPFLFGEDTSGDDLNYKFADLISELSIVFPERFGVEFVMALPEWEQIWKNRRIVRMGFANSLKWRKANAFTEKTHDLINNIDEHISDVIGPLIEISMIVDHPYNALFLHEYLKNLSLPERDSRWTRWINLEAQFEDSQIERIVSWALELSDHPADLEYLKLASIVLTWSLSSSHITLRDRATKALTSIFLADSSVFEFVARLTHDCDDPYLIERLYAAAFGACCLDPTPDRLSSYSKIIYELVFSGGEPPVGLLVRDYALGVMELAEDKEALSSEICLSYCYHPFSSDPPTFDLRKREVEKIAERAGGKRIFWSASGEIGDYGRYSVPSRVYSFLTVPLSEIRPQTSDEIKAHFLAEVIDPFPERVVALNNLDKLIKMKRDAQICSSIALKKACNLLEKIHVDEEAKKLDIQYAEEQRQSREALEQHLSKDEQKRLCSEYLIEGKVNKNEDRVKVDQCRLWITKRAYELGWTAELFPRDGEGAGHSRTRNDLERIGKKYQRIALDELQARLADNYWVLHDDWEIPAIYRYSDHNFRRNIEPTILPTKSKYGESCGNELNWVTQPKVSLPLVSKSDLIKWPFQEDPAASFKNKIFRTDQNGRKWLVLYEFSLDNQEHGNPNLTEHKTRYEEFRYIYCVLIQRQKLIDFVKYLNRKRSLDIYSFQPREFIDRSYLLENHWRDTWKDQKFPERILGIPDDLRFAVPIADYQWENHLDKTLPNGFSKYLPQKWFLDELELRMTDKNASSWINSEGHVVLISVSESEEKSTVVIEEETIVNYASQFNMEPVWIMIAERNAWPSGGNDGFRGRRAEAVAWYDSKKLRKRGWKQDLR